MNTKMLSVLLLLIVAIGFSGAASAASKLVTPAYDEQVLVSAAYDEDVLVSDAYDETIIDEPAYDEQVLVTPAYDEQVLVSPEEFGSVSYSNQIFQTVEEWSAWIWAQPGATGGYGYWTPVYKTVVDQAAYDEQVLVAEAYDEVVTDIEAYDEQVLVTAAYDETVIDQAAYDEQVLVTPASDVQVDAKNFNNYNGAVGWGQAKVNSGAATSYTVTTNYNSCHQIIGYTVRTYKHTDAVYKTVHHDAITHVVHHDAVYQTVHHDAVTHIVHHDAVFETVHHDEVNHQEIDYYLVSGQYYTHIPAVYENVHHDAVYQTVHHDAVTHVEHHDAVYKTVHHDAVYKIVHHDAVYVDIPDPVVPIVEPAAPVTKEVTAKEPNTIPMQHTGGDFTGIIAGIIVLLAGLGIYFGIERRRG